jgi:hypothetical protein
VTSPCRTGRFSSTSALFASSVEESTLKKAAQDRSRTLSVQTGRHPLKRRNAAAELCLHRRVRRFFKRRWKWTRPRPRRREPKTVYEQARHPLERRNAAAELCLHRRVRHGFNRRGSGYPLQPRRSRSASVQTARHLFEQRGSGYPLQPRRSRSASVQTARHPLERRKAAAERVMYGPPGTLLRGEWPLPSASCTDGSPQISVARRQKAVYKLFSARLVRRL